MAWGRCPTHGPIQDARASSHGGVVLLWCRCGLECDSYDASASFVEHDDLKDLAESHRQPREDHETPESPEPTGSIEDYHAGGGWYELPNGERVRGKTAALHAFDEMIDETGIDSMPDEE